MQARGRAAAGAPARAATPAAPPTWLAGWLDKRQLKQQEPAAKPRPTPLAAPQAADPPAASDKARLKREAQRQARMAAGAGELETWLLDLVRQGRADQPARPRGFWENAAARLVDNQLPGLAAALRELATYPGAGSDWASRLLGRLGELYLLLRAWANRDALPPAARPEMAQQVGITVKKDELLADPAALAVADTWLVLGPPTTATGA